MSYTKTIVLDSKHRKSGTFNDCRLTLATPLLDVRKICCEAVSIPNSAFIFSSGSTIGDPQSSNIPPNNVVTFKEGGGGSLTALITPGCYSEGLLALELHTRLTASGALTYASRIQNSPSITKRLVVESTNVFSLLAGSKNFPHRRLGFRPETYTSSLVGGVQTIVSPLPVDLTPPSYVLISIGGLKMDQVAYTGPNAIPFSIAATNTGDSYEISSFASGNSYRQTFSQPIPCMKDLHVVISGAELQSDWLIVLSATTCRLC